MGIHIGNGSETSAPKGFAENAVGRREIELKAMDVIMEMERALGNEPKDVSAQKVGYDIESFDPSNRRLRFIEVKGRIDDADTITVTRNEVITSLHKPDDYILAIIQVNAEFVHQPRYVWQPFTNELEFGVSSQQFELKHLLGKSETPR